jgi:arginyl-tRNA synthetase
MNGGVRESIQDALVAAVRKLGVTGDVPDLELGRAKVPEHGDYASSAGLKLARALRQDPKAIAAQLAATLAVPDGAAKAEAAGGYVNFRFADGWLQGLVARIQAGYGARDIGRGERLQV